MSWFENLPAGIVGTEAPLGAGTVGFPDQGGSTPPTGGMSPFGGTSGSGGGFDLSKFLSGGSSGGKSTNPLLGLVGAGAAGVGLAVNLSQGNKVDPNITNLQNLVASLGPEEANLFSQGNQYMSYLASGTLPPGMQEQINQWAAAAKARFIQNAATSGTSGDPSKNSALAQDLNSVDLQAKMQAAQMASQLLSAGNSMITNGLNFAGMQESIFKYLSDYDLKQSQATGNAISNFAAALGSFGGGIFGGPAGAAAGGAAGKAVGSAVTSG